MEAEKLNSRIHEHLHRASQRLSTHTGTNAIVSKQSSARATSSIQQAAINSRGTRSFSVASQQPSRDSQTSSVATTSSRKKQKNKETAGLQWFDLPKTIATPQISRDMKFIANRGVLDPHRHYKKDSTLSMIPRYSAVGTILPAATTSSYVRSGRGTRSRTIAQSVLAAEKSAGKFRKRFLEIQQIKTPPRHK